jgi:predicted component of type VI protein secretion system
MERGCAVSGCSHIWEIFQCRLLRPSLEGVEPLSYEELVARYGLKSPAQATNALASGKRMFARHLRDVIAQYETGDQAVRAELDALRLFLARLAPAATRKTPQACEPLVPM